MRSKLEIEADTALDIAQSMSQTIVALDRWWPPSRRGSNGQRALDELKKKRDAIEQCLADGLAARP